MHLESFKSFCDLIIQILIPLILNNLHGLNYFEMQNSFKNKFKKTKLKNWFVFITWDYRISSFWIYFLVLSYQLISVKSQTIIIQKEANQFFFQYYLTPTQFSKLMKDDLLRYGVT